MLTSNNKSTMEKSSEAELKKSLSQDVEYFTTQIREYYKDIPTKELQQLVDNMELILNKYRKN